MNLSRIKFNITPVIWLILLCASTTAQTSKLTPEQISAMNNAASDARIAQLSQELAQLRQRLIVVEACAEAGIKPSECDVQPDGTLKRKEPSKEKAKQ